MTLTLDAIMNQAETADYMTNAGYPMTGARLSLLTNSGGGPPCVKKGNQKIFLRPHVDEWLKQELEQRAADEAAS